MISMGVALLTWAWFPAVCYGMAHDSHGRVMMGVASPCDDAVKNLDVDWDPISPEGIAAHTCEPGDGRNYELEKLDPREENLTPEELREPQFALNHACMTERIFYTDMPPRAGPHRPMWPRYGEYLYCPPQRWLHSVEHGAAVFLYHPCAPAKEINAFKRIAKHCLHRRIITPYKELPPDSNFAIVTYGSRLMMSHVNATTGKKAMRYVRDHAINPAPERDVSADGQYELGLTNCSMPDKDHHYDDILVCPILGPTMKSKILNALAHGIFMGVARKDPNGGNPIVDLSIVRDYLRVPFHTVPP